MDRFFIWIGESNNFVMFSTTHFAAIFTILGIYSILFLFSKYIAKNEKADRIIRYTLGSLLIIQEIVLNINRIQSGIWSVSESLPLHLCSFSVILGSIMLFKKSKYLYDILYYWSIGAMIAILTPDLTNQNFPLFRYYQFFFSHGMIILSVLYMAWVHKYKPSRTSLKRTLIFTNALVPIIGLINYLTGGNYFFIARKLETASLLDYLGPWPIYLISLEIVAFTFFSLMYLPYFIKYRKEDKVKKIISNKKIA
jgi:hypothetical integral membrane protein (TIGR02206 family)